MSEIPRDPSHYSLSTHAHQQARWREIDYRLIADTIKDGNIKNSHKDNCKLFIREYEFAQHPVAVVANYEMGVIITVEWRK